MKKFKVQTTKDLYFVECESMEIKPGIDRDNVPSILKFDFNDGTYLAVNMDQVIFFKEEIEEKKVKESAPALVVD